MKKIAIVMVGFFAAFQLSTTANARGGAIVELGAKTADAIRALSKTEEGAKALKDMGFKGKIETMKTSDLNSQYKNMDPAVRDTLESGLIQFQATAKISGPEKAAKEIASSFTLAKKENSLKGVLKVKKGGSDVGIKTDAYLNDFEAQLNAPVEDTVVALLTENPSLRELALNVTTKARSAKSTSGKSIFGDNLASCLHMSPQAFETALTVGDAGASQLLLAPQSKGVMTNAVKAMVDVLATRTKKSLKEARQALCTLSERTGKCRIFSPAVAQPVCI